ncbi:type II toxin-antitoxin system RelE/ParE family toxin [Helicobacter sp. MIT 11-5569]|uniref:type II toxin-antitoxin system RelE family toxin n=1 Tax=Helicobacter sp. MIT 11-5569 TaxID=1548151 RepID=UPI00051F9354|nr:type II toxin-antitoxin system RelE/ParE family toxin [Helicobacter sp. MIT 11-5569]TLD83279.1 type II toxin-antitoxin system RelE/ParE family toxin [Helicobacter sp. MIT 11-5569]
MSSILEYSKDIEKFLLKHRDLAPKILSALELIAQNPYNNTQDTKKMQGYENHYYLRIGKYRILYEIREDKILIIYAYKADSRGEVYKK